MKITRSRIAAVAAALILSFALGACAERMNREDFASVIKGKSEDEVLKNTGKPDKRDDQGADRHVWTYNSRTFDVTNQNKMDDRTIVIFTRGSEGKFVVTEVKFE